jgi:hypothetical protein
MGEVRRSLGCLVRRVCLVGVRVGRVVQGLLQDQMQVQVLGSVLDQEALVQLQEALRKGTEAGCVRRLRIRLRCLSLRIAMAMGIPLHLMVKIQARDKDMVRARVRVRAKGRVKVKERDASGLA